MSQNVVQLLRAVKMVVFPRWHHTTKDSSFNKLEYISNIYLDFAYLYCSAYFVFNRSLKSQNHHFIL